MEVGDLVKVETKHYGEKTGFVIEKVEDSYGVSWVIAPTDHPRNILAESQDLKVISKACS
tara:strand:+ start:63 stop:242 length:180 start_codon:yes stop_codon:yes gene_type:complete